MDWLLLAMLSYDFCPYRDVTPLIASNILCTNRQVNKFALSDCVVVSESKVCQKAKAKDFDNWCHQKSQNVPRCCSNDLYYFIHQSQILPTFFFLPGLDLQHKVTKLQRKET